MTNAAFAGMTNAAFAGMTNAAFAGMTNAAFAGMTNAAFAGMTNAAIAGMTNAAPFQGEALRRFDQRAVCDACFTSPHHQVHFSLTSVKRYPSQAR
jgi:hypothetical protein